MKLEGLFRFLGVAPMVAVARGGHLMDTRMVNKVPELGMDNVLSREVGRE
jgi:hypothetical protein